MYFMTYLLLRQDINVSGMCWAAGLKALTDAGWIKLLREQGADVITEEEYEEMTAEPKAAEAAATVPAMGDIESGESTASGIERDQISLADSVKQHRSRRTARRV